MISHFNSLRKGIHHNLYLQRSWNKYGEENFIFEILEKCEESILLLKEKEWILKQKVVYNSQAVNPETFKWRHTEETINKISLKRTGQKQSPETIAKKIAKQIGQKRSLETKKLMSIKAKERERKKKENGYIFSNEHKLKLREAAKRKPPCSDETKKKISLGLKNKPKSEEHKRKLSEKKKGKLAWNKGLKGSTWKSRRLED